MIASLYSHNRLFFFLICIQSCFTFLLCTLCLCSNVQSIVPELYSHKKYVEHWLDNTCYKTYIHTYIWVLSINFTNNEITQQNFPTLPFLLIHYSIFFLHFVTLISDVSITSVHMMCFIENNSDTLAHCLSSINIWGTVLHSKMLHKSAIKLTSSYFLFRLDWSMCMDRLNKLQYNNLHLSFPEKRWRWTLMFSNVTANIILFQPFFTFNLNKNNWRKHI